MTSSKPQPHSPETANAGLRGALAYGHATVLDACVLTIRTIEWATLPLQLVSESNQPDEHQSEWRCTASGWTDLRASVRLSHVTSAAREQLEIRTIVTSALQRQLARASLSLWHPINLLGREIRFDTRYGVVKNTLAQQVNPAHVATGFTKLSYSLPDAEVDLDFCGTRMEMEDHRNWTDAGWKSYCPPLADGPITIGPSAPATHACVVTVTSRPARRTGGAGRRTNHVGAAAIEWSSKTHPLPELGTRLGPDGGAGLPVAGFLELEGPSGLRLLARVDPARPLWLTVTTAADELPDWVAAVRETLAPVRGVCFIPAGSLTSDPELTLRTSRLLADASSLIGTGTRGYLAEFQRRAPGFGSTAGCAGADYVQLSTSATVHSTDLLRVMDTVIGQRFAVPAAATSGLPVVIAPVMITQRLSVHDPSTWLRHTPEDPLAATPFGAAWLLGSLIALRRATAASLMSLEALICSGILTPAGRLLDRLHSHWSGTAVRAGTTGHRAMAVALGTGADATEPRLLVANLTPGSLALEPTDTVPALINLAPYEVVEHRNGEPVWSSLDQNTESRR